MNKSIGVAFDQYIADDIAKYAGVTMPVKAGLFNRIMVTKALCTALKLGYEKIPIQVINVTSNREIKDIIKNSKHDKRVNLDLDEVVFWNPNNGPAEKDLLFTSTYIIQAYTPMAYFQIGWPFFHLRLIIYQKRTGPFQYDPLQT